MHKIITFLMIGGLSLITFGQDKDADNIRRVVLKKSYVTLYGDRVVFQDAKFSAIPYSGMGGRFAFGTSRETSNYYWETNFSGRLALLKTKFHSGTGKNIQANWSFDYTRKLTDNYQLGGKLDMASGNMTIFESLGNNSSNIIFSSTLSVLGRYTRTLNDNFQLNFDLSIGLLSLVKESTSFAYSASQKVLEEGIFNFQNKSTISPFSLKHGSVVPIGTLNKIRTSLSVDYKKRWNLSYSWNLFNYRTVKGYPITIATHSIGVRFNYINKEKTRTIKK